MQVLDAPSLLWLLKHLCPHSHVSKTRARFDGKLVLFSRALNAERLICSVPDGGEGSVIHSQAWEGIIPELYFLLNMPTLRVFESIYNNAAKRGHGTSFKHSHFHFFVIPAEAPSSPRAPRPYQGTISPKSVRGEGFSLLRRSAFLLSLKAAFFKTSFNRSSP